MSGSLSPAIEIGEDRTFDPADVFARVFGHLETKATRMQRSNMSDWRADDDGNGSTTALAEGVLRSGVVTATQISEAMDSPRRAFLLLRAIDKAFATIDPYSGAHDHGMLGRHQHRFRTSGRYNSDARLGYVFPRRTYPARPQSVPDRLAEHCTSLIFVSEIPEHLHLKTVQAIFEFDTEIRGAEKITVACVPFLDRLEELDIARVGRGGSYSIRLRTGEPSWLDHWARRSEKVLANLDQSEAHIAVLPELSLTDEMLTWWQRMLRRTPRPDGSHLQWILVGSGPLQQSRTGRKATVDPPPNRAVLLSRIHGRTIMWQDKSEPFSLDDAQIKKWQLDADLGAGPLAEWKQDNDDRYLLDSRVGRIAVMICEDLGRYLTVGAKIAPLEPTHLFSPIFAPPILRYRWQEQAAMQFATTTGTTTVIANSQAIRAAGDDNVPSGTALVVQPDGRGPSSSWAIEARLGDTGGDPAGVVTFAVPRS